MVYAKENAGIKAGYSAEEFKEVRQASTAENEQRRL